MRILFYANAMPTFFSPVRAGQSYLTGGWITGALNALANEPDLDLACSFPISKGEAPFRGIHRNVTCFGIPMAGGFTTNADADSEEPFTALLEDYQPDVIHIWGTESAAALPLVRAANRLSLKHRCAIHIQGVIAEIAKTYPADLPTAVQHRFTLRDLLRRDNIAAQQRSYFARAEVERDLLLSVENVFGRTDFDRAAVKAIAPETRYFSINENLRESFYQARWERENARPHRLFFSQGNYPLKGLHLLLESLPAVIEQYPDLELIIAGGDPTRSGEGLRGRLLISSYGQYIKQLMRKNRLEKHLRFLGPLSEMEMLQCYCDSAVFISCSVCENSPNSIAEAMLLGLPIVATRVGGVPSVLNEDEALLLPFGDCTALSDAILSCLNDPAQADTRAARARQHAQITHDPHRNREALLAAYKAIAAKDA